MQEYRVGYSSLQAAVEPIIPKIGGVPQTPLEGSMPGRPAQLVAKCCSRYSTNTRTLLASWWRCGYTA